MRRWGCYEYSIFILGLIFIGAMGLVGYLFVVIIRYVVWQGSAIPLENRLDFGLLGRSMRRSWTGPGGGARTTNPKREHTTKESRLRVLARVRIGSPLKRPFWFVSSARA